MAIVQNPVTGRTRKKFGSAVFTKQFGKNIMRTKPLEVKNPRTPDQVNQRTKFKLMIHEGRLLLGLVKVSFKAQATTMSAFNAFIKNNIRTAVTGVPGNYTIDYPSLVVAKGPVMKTNSVLGSSDVVAKIKCTWAPPINPLDPINDDVLAVASYDTTSREWLYEISTTKRLAGIYEQAVPAAWSGSTAHVFTFFVSPDMSKASDSVYGGLVAIL